jgi:hypothetical protein
METSDVVLVTGATGGVARRYPAQKEMEPVGAARELQYHAVGSPSSVRLIVQGFLIAIILMNSA